MGTMKASDVDHLRHAGTPWQPIATNYSSKTVLVPTNNPKIYTVFDTTTEPHKPLAHITRRYTKTKETWIVYPAPEVVKYKSMRHRISQAIPNTESVSLGVSYAKYCGYLEYVRNSPTSK